MKIHRTIYFYLRYDENALAQLQLVLDRIKKSICLKAGDLLIVDNKRTVHGRTNFVPSYNFKDRWLQRAKVIKKLD
ncbi:MAG: hypothetical protein DRG78_16235 [Epsilonproteobacteria bacterium]|nr:MAG: hypothetical protein DRG78_16235 [Campylobacterota bacterium]